MKKAIFMCSCSLFLCGCDELAQKGTQTCQNALEDSGLKDTLIEHGKKLDAFLDSNKTQEFIEKQNQILQESIDEFKSTLESNTTKEHLQKQMENLNEMLGGESKSQDSNQTTFDL